MWQVFLARQFFSEIIVGPVAFKRMLEPFCPTPTIRLNAGHYALDYDRPKSIGRVRSFVGNFGMMVRAYAYLRDYRRNRADIFHEADTLDGLASSMRVPRGALAATVATYNATGRGRLEIFPAYTGIMTTSMSSAGIWAAWSAFRAASTAPCESG